MKQIVAECKRYIAQNKQPVPQKTIKRLVFRKEISIPQVQQYLAENMGASFNERLFVLIDKSGQKDSDVYKKALIDRRLFSKIRCDKRYVPSKKTVLALCIALQLTEQEANQLLSSAGYSLSRASEFDLAIAFCLNKQQYNFNDINEMLYQLGLDVF